MTLTDLSHVRRAARFAHLCRLVYAPPPEGVSIEELNVEHFYYPVSVDGIPLGLSGFVAHGDADVVLVFCGTKPPSEHSMDWLSNWTINLGASQTAGYGGMVHRGFAAAMGSIWDDMAARLGRHAQRGRKLWLTGHSLGGALATLAACRCAAANLQVAMVYTFGSPRVGDRAFAERYRFQHYRFENRNDVVAYLCPPPDDMQALAQALAERFLEQVFHKKLPENDFSLFNYRHVGQCQFLAWDGTLRNEPASLIPERALHVADAVTDHRISNYVDALDALA